jgi:ribosomal protein S18 acetylase RimI-like enzyme
MITYSFNNNLDLKKVKQLYVDSTLSERRPINNPERLKKMFSHSNLIISAWDEKELVGLCRGFTDYGYVTYISDLAVAKNFQSKGIGKELLKKAQGKGGKDTKLVLLSAPGANTYYDHLGFEHHPRAWTLDEKLI